VSFDRAVGYLISEEGRGVQTIIDMVTLTRLDCAVSSAG
jgi:putative acyl-CoA dehydrogenase